MVQNVAAPFLSGNQMNHFYYVSRPIYLIFGVANLAKDFTNNWREAELTDTHLIYKTGITQI